MAAVSDFYWLKPILFLQLPLTVDAVSHLNGSREAGSTSGHYDLIGWILCIRTEMGVNVDASPTPTTRICTVMHGCWSDVNQISKPCIAVQRYSVFFIVWKSSLTRPARVRRSRGVWQTRVTKTLPCLLLPYAGDTEFTFTTTQSDIDPAMLPGPSLQ